MSGFGPALLGGGLSALGGLFGGDNGPPWSAGTAYRTGLAQQYGQRAMSLGALQQYQRALLGGQAPNDPFFNQQLGDARAYSNLGRGYLDATMGAFGEDWPQGMPFRGKNYKQVGREQVGQILGSRDAGGLAGAAGMTMPAGAAGAQGQAGGGGGAPSILDEIRRLGAQRFGDYSAGAQGVMGRYDADIAGLNPLFARAMGDTASSKAAIEQQYGDTVRNFGAEADRDFARRGFGGSTARTSAEGAIRADALGGKLSALASLDNEQASRAQGLAALRASLASGRAGMHADLFGRGQAIAQGSTDQELGLRQQAAQQQLQALYSPGAVNFGPYTPQNAYAGYQQGPSATQNIGGALGNVGGMLSSFGIAQILGAQRQGGGGGYPGLMGLPGGGVYDVFGAMR